MTPPPPEPPLVLFDTHCHLGHGEEPGQTAGERVARAHAAGVIHLLDVGIDLPSSRDALARARRFAAVRASVGLHPNDAGRFAADFAALAELARDTACVAVGETGLDFYWDRAPRALQEESFHAHLALGAELDKPVIVHARDAMAATLAVLEAHRGVRKVMHCFAGDETDALRAVELGCWLSFAGPLTYPRAEALRRAAVATPIDRLLIETDSPFLPPQSRRGKSNEPAFVIETAMRLAELRGITLAELAQTTTANALALFDPVG